MKKNILLIVAAGLFLVYTKAWAEEWTIFGNTKDYIWYYDAQSIKPPSNDLVRLWAKLLVKDESIAQKTIEARKGYNLSIKGYENFIGTKELIEVKCSTNQYRIISLIEIDSKENILDSHSSESSNKLTFIARNSAIENLHKIICPNNGEDKEEIAL